MCDARIGIGRVKTVEQCLVGDLPGCPDVPRLEDGGMAAHERAPPMRGRAGNMSDARGRRAREKFRGRFAGAREDEGRARQHRAKINLQAAVASNVVKGAPYRWRTGRRLGRQRAAEALEGVKDELRRSGGPGGQ